MVARADAPHRSGVPALPLRRLHGRALPQAAGHGSDDGLGAVVRREQGRSRSPAAATRCGAASRCGCCRRPRRSPRTCRRRSAPRSRIEQAQAPRPRAADPGRQHRDLLVRRRVSQPRHRADGAFNAAAVDRVPEAAGAGAVRVRGQRHRHLGEDAARLDRATRFRSMAGPRLLLRRRPRPGQRLRPTCSAPSSTAARTRRPTFLHLRTTRIMGHAGTDFEIEWRSLEELMRGRSRATRCCARRRSRCESGLMSKDEVLGAVRSDRASSCFAAAEDADRRPKLDDAAPT